MPKALSKDELARWRSELDLGLEFRDKEFGTYRKQQPGAPPMTTLAGLNLDDFEQGARSGDQSYEPPLNIVFPIVKNIVPTLLFRNPRAHAIPTSRASSAADDAFYVSTLINQDLRDVDFRFKDTGQQTVFSSFVLGFGVVKLGYATETGPDILPDEQEQAERTTSKLKQVVDGIKVQLGLKQPDAPSEPDPERVQANTVIRSESPYMLWVDPFDFVVDPRARDITDARWVAQRIRKTLKEVKADPRYGKDKHELTPDVLEDDHIPEAFVEDFQVVDVWEVHYKEIASPTGIRILTFAATQEQTKELMHVDSVYDLGGWQFEWLVLNKHGHRLYPISTISVIRPLIDRINNSFDAILEQVDKFQAKIAHNERVTADGEMALESAVIGARVKIQGDQNVGDAIKVISMEQVKADMVAFVERIVDFVILITGLTRAQLTGLTTAQTATEAQIGQSGQNLRRSDEAEQVSIWVNRVVSKLWRIKAQFQDLTEIDLVQETDVPNPQGGMNETTWFPAIDELRAARLKRTKYKFHIEVGSMQKPNLEIVRAQYEQFARALMEQAVTQGLALEGKRLSASEIIRQWAKFFEEYGLQDLSKIVVPVTDPTMQASLLNYGQQPTGNGSRARVAAQSPNRADLISRAAGEKGQGASPV